MLLFSFIESKAITYGLYVDVVKFYGQRAQFSLVTLLKALKGVGIQQLPDFIPADVSKNAKTT